MALKSLLLKDLNDLNSKLVTPINYIDLDYNLINSGTSQGKTQTRSTVLHGDYAVLNAYRLWLQSKKYDYIRAPSFGGMFDQALNDRFSLKEENEKSVQEFIKAESSKNWPQINILEIKAKAEISKKNWLVHILAQDKKSGMVLLDSISYIVN